MRVRVLQDEDYELNEKDADGQPQPELSHEKNQSGNFNSLLNQQIDIVLSLYNVIFLECRGELSHKMGKLEHQNHVKKDDECDGSR